MRFLLLLAVFFSIFLHVTGCAHEEIEPLRRQIELDDLAFTPEVIEARVGDILMIELTNAGQSAHELMIGRSVKLVDGRPSGYLEDLFAVSGVEPLILNNQAGEQPVRDTHAHSHTGTTVSLAKTGDQASLTFRVTEAMLGEWEMGCFELQGAHYTAGMTGKLIILPASTAAAP